MISLNRVLFDDLLLDDLGSALPRLVDGIDQHLCLLLLASRATVETGPVPELVDTDTAVATIACSAGSKRRARRNALRTAAAAVVLLAALVGLGLMLTPVTGLWWAVPAVGASGLAGALTAVIRMRPEPNWSARELTGENGASS